VYSDLKFDTRKPGDIRQCPEIGKSNAKNWFILENNPFFLSHGSKYNGRCNSQHKLQNLYVEGVQNRDVIL
jgi:hypothetical protein